MTFIRKVKTASGATAVQIVRKESGRIVQVDHIGSAHTKEQLEALVVLAKKRLIGNQIIMFPEHEPPKIILKKPVSRLLFDVLASQYASLGFQAVKDKVFSYLCLARMVEPVSKLDSIRVIEELGVGTLSNAGIHRCLKRIIGKDYRKIVTDLCFAHAEKRLALVLYDVTSLYFEIQKEDEFRKSGMSKERRLEPQIIIGLLVNQQGFPLQIHSFEGNIAETKIILPVMEAFKKEHGLINITVVADAAMLSKNNLEALEKAGYTYIVGSKLQKIPYDIAEYRKTSTLSDLQIITTNLTDKKRIIYQYREKRATLDLRNIEKQVKKAQEVVMGTRTDKRTKFLTQTTKNRILNQKLIEKAKSLIGIKGYVTNLLLPDQEIVSLYHELWQVEKAFRMSKSDLKARPIFHHRRDSIEAHLTIVFTALAVSKSMEKLTGITIKRFIKTIRPIRTGNVIINGKEYQTEAEMFPEVKKIMDKLQRGY